MFKNKALQLELMSINIKINLNSEIFEGQCEQKAVCSTVLSIDRE